MSNDEEFKEWVASKPLTVQEVIKTHPPQTCYRGISNGHYRLYAYDEEDDDTITLRATHLDDSFLPGVTVFGLDPKDLKICGCGLQQ